MGLRRIATEMHVRSEDLYEVVHAGPFRPFDLILANGTRLHVLHPEWTFHPTQHTRGVVVHTPEDDR